jgi:hypothetical protein
VKGWFSFLQIVYAAKNYICLTYKTKSTVLIKSISGIRGTIGGKVGENLTPADVLKHVGDSSKTKK